jgi:hypothetical protein
MKKLLFLFFCLLSCLTGSAQLTPNTVWESSSAGTAPWVQDFLFGLQVGVPSREMRPAIHNRMGDVGFGASLLVLSDPFTWGKNKRESVLRIGGGLGYTYYGRFKSVAQVNGYEGSLKAAYGILDAKAIVRFRPQLDRGFYPFVDVQAGGDFYMSSINEDLNGIESALGIEPTEFQGTFSASFTKGIGGGMAIGSRDPRKGKLVVRVMYNWGTRVKYIVRNSLIYSQAENSLSYQTGRAPVRYVQVQVGIGL